MTIDTFSFRYADTAGFMEWFRYNLAQGLWIDRCDGAMQAKQLPDDGGGAGRAGGNHPRA